MYKFIFLTCTGQSHALNFFYGYGDQIDFDTFDKLFCKAGYGRGCSPMSIKQKYDKLPHILWMRKQGIVPHREAKFYKKPRGDSKRDPDDTVSDAKEEND